MSPVEMGYLSLRYKEKARGDDVGSRVIITCSPQHCSLPSQDLRLYSKPRHPQIRSHGLSIVSATGYWATCL